MPREPNIDKAHCFCLRPLRRADDEEEKEEDADDEEETDGNDEADDADADEEEEEAGGASSERFTFTMRHVLCPDAKLSLNSDKHPLALSPTPHDKHPSSTLVCF